MNISLLTLVHGRTEALQNTLSGIAAGTTMPDEVVIVHLNEPAGLHQGHPYPVRSFSIDTGSHLNLAAARNHAAVSAGGDHLIFLDVDCIPAADLVATYADSFAAGDMLWSGKVRYLEPTASSHPAWRENMQLLSRPDPVREGLTEYSYDLFWSLNFGCSKSIFQQIGGFDANFAGYGGEDTDFGYSAAARGIRLRVNNALAYHQHHDSYAPPLNHLEAIVQNASLFFRKWNKWPMPGWLEAFRTLGLVHWDSQSLRIRRLPTATELNSARR